MTGQHAQLLLDPFWIELLQRLRNATVQLAPLAPQQAAIGCFRGQLVLEYVGCLWQLYPLADHLCSL